MKNSEVIAGTVQSGIFAVSLDGLRGTNNLQSTAKLANAILFWALLASVRLDAQVDGSRTFVTVSFERTDLAA